MNSKYLQIVISLIVLILLPTVHYISVVDKTPWVNWYVYGIHIESVFIDTVLLIALCLQIISILFIIVGLIEEGVRK